MISGRLCLLKVQGLLQSDSVAGKPQKGTFLEEVLPKGCVFVCAAQEMAWQYGWLCVWDLAVLTEKAMEETTWKRVRGDVVRKLNLWGDEFQQGLNVVSNMEEGGALKKWKRELRSSDQTRSVIWTGNVDEWEERL